MLGNLHFHLLKTHIASNNNMVYVPDFSHWRKKNDSETFVLSNLDWKNYPWPMVYRNFHTNLTESTWPCKRDQITKGLLKVKAGQKQADFNSSFAQQQLNVTWNYTTNHTDLTKNVRWFTNLTLTDTDRTLIVSQLKMKFIVCLMC